MIPLLGAVGGEPYSSEARTAIFFVVTAGVVVASLLIVRRVRDYELVVLGLVVAAAAVGYGLLAWGAPAENVLPGGTPELARTVMKVAVVLVLAGVARSLLLACSGESASDTPKP